MIRTIAIAILSVVLMGATTVYRHPACPDSPEQYRSFVKAIMTEDRFAVQFYLQIGCGFLAVVPADILEFGPYWVRVRVKPPQGEPATLYTSPVSIRK